MAHQANSICALSHVVTLRPVRGPNNAGVHRRGAVRVVTHLGD